MNPARRSSSLRKRIEQVHRKSGFDLTFGTAIANHLNVLNDFENGKDLNTRAEMCDLLLSKFFFDKLEMFLTKKFKCNIDENSDWPVPILPAEVFSDAKVPDEYRKQFFFNCLKVGDVLDCRVSSVQPTEYQLRVIHKYGVARILDDLNLIVTLKRTKKELIILEKDLLECELIRVAVSEVGKQMQNVVVTVSKGSFDIVKKLPELGRISDKELPPYVLDPPDPEKYLSYADYLDNTPEFKNCLMLNDIIEGFGLNIQKVYSFYPNLDELECTDELTGQSLLKQSKKNESRSYADAATKEQRKKKYVEALALLEKAFKCCPENDPYLAVLYDLKATIYLHKDNNIHMYALCSNAACKFDPNNQAKKKLAKTLFKAANGFYKKKMFKKSAYLAEKSLEVYPNELASGLLDVLKTKHAEIFMNLEKDSIYQLQVKKKRLVTELKKMDIC